MINPVDETIPSGGVPVLHTNTILARVETTLDSTTMDDAVTNVATIHPDLLDETIPSGGVVAVAKTATKTRPTFPKIKIVFKDDRHNMAGGDVINDNMTNSETRD